MNKNFKPFLLLKNKHIQTIYSSVFRKVKNHNYFIEKFNLSDGDFLEAYWYNKHTYPNKPLVILFHGLAGSYKSPYILGMMERLDLQGYNSVLMHYRSTSGVMNLKPICYHSGKTDDAKEFILSIKERFPNSKLFSIGFSLGANMMLKLLGEYKLNSPFQASVSVSAPMNLTLSSNKINSGLSKFYQKYLLKTLNKELEKKYLYHDMESLIKIKKQDIKKISTFWEFDEIYTAPIHGFSSAEDYYIKSSSAQYLKYIKTPTLIIHAKDDPFMPFEVIPKNNAEISSDVELEVYENGGHVGFVHGSFLKPIYFLEQRVPQYFNNFV